MQVTSPSYQHTNSTTHDDSERQDDSLEAGLSPPEFCHNPLIDVGETYALASDGTQCTC